MKSFILLAIFIGCFSLCAQAQLIIGQDAPDIKLPDSLGKWTTLSEVKANIVLVDFWAAWCPPCKITAIELKKIKEKYAKQSFEIFAISLDRDYWNWVNKVRALDLPFIHVNDAYGLKSPRCKAYNVTNIPSKFLLKNGKLLLINPSFEQIENALKEEQEPSTIE